MKLKELLNILDMSREYIVIVEGIHSGHYLKNSEIGYKLDLIKDFKVIDVTIRHKLIKIIIE